MKYFPDVPIDGDTLAWDYPQVYQYCMDYHLAFLFEEPLPCNLSLVCEFYANMNIEARSQVVKVWEIEVNITFVTINRILGTLDVPSALFIELQIPLP